MHTNGSCSTQADLKEMSYCGGVVRWSATILGHTYASGALWRDARAQWKDQRDYSKWFLRPRIEDHANFDRMFSHDVRIALKATRSKTELHKVTTVLSP